MWLYTGGVWAQPDQKRTKFDRADEPFSLSEGCTLGVRSAIRARRSHAILPSLFFPAFPSSSSTLFKRRAKHVKP